MLRSGKPLRLAAGAIALAAAASAASAGANIGAAAPDFRLRDSRDATVKLSKFKGKVVLLDFWATWCHGCKLEIPWFMEFHSKYKSSGLAVIGAAMDEDGWKAVKPYIQSVGINYQVVLGNREFARTYGAAALPVTVLIGRDGRIAASYAGVLDRRRCEDEIRTLLAK